MTIHQRDQSCFIATAREEGWKLGHEQGIEEGREEGREEGVKQGREDQSRALILQIGTKRLGPPSEAIVEKLRAVKSLDHLHLIADHVLDCPDWDALAAQISSGGTV